MLEICVAVGPFNLEDWRCVTQSRFSKPSKRKYEGISEKKSVKLFVMDEKTRMIAEWIRFCHKNSKKIYEIWLASSNNYYIWHQSAQEMAYRAQKEMRIKNEQNSIGFPAHSRGGMRGRIYRNIRIRRLAGNGCFWEMAREKCWMPFLVQSETWRRIRIQIEVGDF